MPAGFNLGLVTAITSIAGTAGEILVNGGVAPVQGGGVVISIADGPSSISGEMYYLMTGISGALSTRLTASGVALIARDASISGGLEARIWATGAAAVAANLATIASTGQQAWTAANNNAINLSGRLTSTGAALVQRDIDISGGLEARIRATGAAAIAAVTSIIANTGQQAWTAANNNGINLSGRLAATGSALDTKINQLSGYANGAFVTVVGNQTVQGDKVFLGTTTIQNLVVTGTQTIVNTQTVDVGSNYLLLNATGGARDGGVFISTGLTGVGELGPILGYDVPANRWVFGVGTRNGDLSSLSVITSLTTLTTASGLFLSTIASTGQQAWLAARNNAVNLSGNITQSGTIFIARDVAISGDLNTRLIATGLIAWSAANNNGINLSGNLGATGSALVARDLSISGFLAAQIASSSAGVTNLNGQSGVISIVGTGNLFVRTGVGNIIVSGSGIAQTADLVASGSLLFLRDTTISGGLEARIALTGQQAWTAALNHAINLSGRLAVTGSNLWQQILTTSGALQSQIGGVTVSPITAVRNSTGNFTITGDGSWGYSWSGDVGVQGTGTLADPIALSGYQIIVKNRSTGAFLLLSGSVDYSTNYVVTPRAAVRLWSDSSTWLII